MVHFSQKKLHIGGILFLFFNEISINISWLEHPVRIFGFRTFKFKDYTCITFNEDIFNYGNRKSDSIWVQIESLLAAQKKYDAKAKRLELKIFPSEQDILDKILEVSADGGYAPYIKRLIREDIERNKE